jgi:hypothetical protein
MLHNQSMDHLINSLTSTKVNLSFEFQVNNCEIISKSQQWNGENPFHFNLIVPNTQNLANQVSQQQEVEPQEPPTTSTNLHKTLPPIVILIYPNEQKI